LIGYTAGYVYLNAKALMMQKLLLYCWLWALDYR